MTAIAQRRVAGATALMILLYLLQAALFAPPAQAAEPLGGAIQNTFVNYDPSGLGWTPGQNPQYVEGDVIPLSFSVEGATVGLEYEFTACFDYYYGTADAHAFIGLADYDASYSPEPRGGPVTKYAGGAASDGATVSNVELLGINDELCGGTTNRQSIGFKITLTPTASNFFMYFGAQTARAGFDTAMDTTVTNGVISWPTGTFQAYLAQTTGNKTVNFKPSAFVPFDANVSVVMFACEMIDGKPVSLVRITIEPEGAPVTITIKGPGLPEVGKPFTASEDVKDLAPGSYTWEAEASGDYVITPPSSGTFTIRDCVATVKVVKAVEGAPDDDDSEFGFSITNPAGTFELKDGKDKKFDYEIPVDDSVNVTVVEDKFPSANWTLKSISCKDDAEEDRSKTVGTENEAKDGIVLTLNDGDEITCTFTNLFTPDGTARVIVKKEVNTGAPAATFDFTITDEDDFELAGGGEKTFNYVIPVDSEGEDVTVAEDTSGLPVNWAFTSLSCDSDEDETNDLVASRTVTLNDKDVVTCTFVNTYTPPPPPVVTTTTTTAPPEVAGTTVTTAPEVVAETLPFTGFETGDTLKLGLLAMLAGALMLFAVRGPRREEETGDDIGGWSVL